MTRLFLRLCLVMVAVNLIEVSLVEAGPFRRYPRGSARSQYTRIAYNNPASAGGALGATESGLPPMPRGEDVADIPDPTGDNSPYMQALERPAGCCGVAEEVAENGLAEWWESMHGGDGIYFEYVYTGEYFTNTRGGIKTGSEYEGNLDIVMTLELEELGLELGGTFFFYAQNSHGRALTENYVGDFQTYSNIDAPDFTQVSEFWYERDVIEDFMAVRIGKQDANAEFAVVDLGGDFIQSSFGFSPTIPLVTFPVPAMGITTFWQLSDTLSFKAGVFDGGTTLDEWGFSEEGHALSMFELKSTHELGGLPGDLHAGIWYHGGVFDQLSTGGTIKGNHGVYFGADQLIWKEAPWDEESDQGIGVFAQYSWVPQDRNELRWHLGGGVVYKGPIDCRDDDVLGLGYSRVEYGRHAAGQSAETVIELFYKAPIDDRLTLQPDLQYIGRPSGMLRDALVVGLRFELAL